MALVSRRTTQPTLPFDEHANASQTRAPRATPPRRGEVPRAVVDRETRTSPIAFVLVRSPRARRYILRLRPDGVVRVTIPFRGSRREALDVIERHRLWIERQWRQRAAVDGERGTWRDGTSILFRGGEVALLVAATASGARIEFADQVVSALDPQQVRAAVERRLRDLACEELEPRLRSLAEQFGVSVTHVTVRDQRTRWGSCSRSGRISLNWRLVQMPPFVCDYILLHELMHTRQANHSRRFWREVETVCPGYREAEQWLRHNGRTLWS